MAQIRLPPGCGSLINEPLLYQEYQQRFTRARRLRFCLSCRTIGSMDEMGRFQCAKCGKEHNGRWGNLSAPRAFNTFSLLSGRGGGKTLIGAHAVREELMIPGAVWWILGPTYKMLWDSTFPTLSGLLHPDWIKRWDGDKQEITLKNDSVAAFRSLEDPERARGPHGVAGFWFDEAAQSPERAWHVATPMLMKAGGIAIASTTALGFDWTYELIERKALVYRERGYWAAKWRTIDNPLYRSNPVMMMKIEQARKTMTPEFFAQEYEGGRENAQGLIYGQLAEKNFLEDDAAVRRFIPEWPNISPSRKVLIGLDEGADHPFGAVLIVVTEFGLVVVGDYLERMKATSLAHDDIHIKLGLHRWSDRTYSANKNALNLRLEWGLKNTGVIKAESDQETGIQRTQSWLVTGQLKFAYTARRTFEQMKAYRRKDNTVPSTGEKKVKEDVFKLRDELCDAVRYALMTFPELPRADGPGLSEDEQRRLAAFDPKTRRELEILAEIKKRKQQGEDVLTEADKDYPMGDFYGHEGGPEEARDFSFMY